MNLAKALHTAAIRYCNEQFSHWTQEYAKITSAGRERKADGYHYSDEALNVFPRYNLINAIRVELECLDPDELTEFESTFELLIQTGENAEDDFTREPKQLVKARALMQERELFCAFIRELSQSDLQAVEPLPYRRVLSTSESETVWSKVQQRWQITEGYWFPLADCSLPDIVAFQNTHINKFFEGYNLPRLLASRGISRVWELREHGPEYELDVSLMHPHYNGAEGYWISEGLDWIIYASHESSTTIGGWLLDDIKDHWLEWEQRIWNTPFF